MARREYARIGVNMPEEESIKALNVEPQWLYDRLLLRPEISRCGVIPWVPRTIAELAANATERKVASWVRQLQPGRHVILDDRHQQLLVRTFVKHDKLLAQPNVVPNLVYEFGHITSPKVRVAFLQEFRRLWSLTPDDDFSDSERGGWLLAVRHFPMRKDPDNPAHQSLRWPVALDTRTLGRLTKEIGPTLRNALSRAIADGDVEPFTDADPHGIPDPFRTPHPTTPPAHPTPTPHPGRGPVRTRAHSETETETGTGTGTGYFVPPTPETVTVQPDPASPSSPDTHEQATQLITDHAGRVTGAVRLALTHHVTELLEENHPPADIAAAITDWRAKPGSGAGLLPWLLTERLLRRDNATAKRNGHDHRPAWCGHCDQTTRTEPTDPDDTHSAYRRCPRCHPLAEPPAAAATTVPASGPGDPAF